MYTCVRFAWTDPAALAVWLNEQYEKGWELVGMHDNYFVFKER